MHWHIALVGLVLVLVGMVWLGRVLEGSPRPSSISALLLGPAFWPLLTVMAGAVAMKVAAILRRRRPPGEDEE